MTSMELFLGTNIDKYQFRVLISACNKLLVSQEGNPSTAFALIWSMVFTSRICAATVGANNAAERTNIACSYKHLTLPTKRTK